MEKLDLIEKGFKVVSDDQFAIEIDFENNKRRIIEPGKHYKEERTEWYIFTKNTVEIKKEKSIKIGIIDASYEYNVIVLSNLPADAKDILKIFSPHKSEKQLIDTIELEILQKFNNAIHDDQLYINLKSKFDKFLKEFNLPCYSPEDIASRDNQIVELEMLIQEIQSDFCSNFQIKEDKFNGFFKISPRIISITVQDKIFKKIEEAKINISKERDQFREDEKFNKKFNQDTILKSLEIIVNGTKDMPVPPKGFSDAINFLTSEVPKLLIESNPMKSLPDNKIKQLNPPLLNFQNAEKYADKLTGIKNEILPTLKLYKRLDNANIELIFNDFLVKKREIIAGMNIKEIITLFISDIQREDYLILRE